MLDISFVSEQGKRFFPITHRQAIVGLATNTLVMSESVDVDIDINVDGEPITINPIVQTEITNINTSITNINEALETKATSDTAGIALSTHKLQTPRTITISGSVTGNVAFDGSSDVTISVATNHTHNYAGSSSAGGNADAAVKLATARAIGNANFDGTANITLAQIGAAAASHTHPKSQITDFPASLKNPNALTISLNGSSQGAYDGSAAKSINITPGNIGAATSGHTHNYAGSSSAGGNANAAVKLATARNIKLSGVVNGNANFDGTGNITISTTFGNSSNYLPLSGGTITGSFTANGNIQSHGRYYQGSNVGSLTAIQSGSPTGTMLWAY